MAPAWFLSAVIAGTQLLCFASAQVVVVTVTHTRRPSTCSNPYSAPFTSTVIVPPSSWSAVATPSISSTLSASNGWSSDSYTSVTYNSASQASSGWSSLLSSIQMESSAQPQVTSTPSQSDSGASSTVQFSTIEVSPTPIDDYIASGEPFNLEFEFSGFGKAKRQSSVRVYVKANGNTTTDRSKAVEFRIRDNELYANGTKISTRPEVNSQLLAAVLPIGPITTNFSSWAGQLSWNNSAFDNGKAEFFRVPPNQAENAQVVVKFRGENAPEWRPIAFTAAPAVKTATSSSVTMPSTNPSNSKGPSTSPTTKASSAVGTIPTQSGSITLSSFVLGSSSKSNGGIQTDTAIRSSTPTQIMPSSSSWSADSNSASPSNWMSSHPVSSSWIDAISKSATKASSSWTDSSPASSGSVVATLSSFVLDISSVWATSRTHSEEHTKFETWSSQWPSRSSSSIGWSSSISWWSSSKPSSISRMDSKSWPSSSWASSHPTTSYPPSNSATMKTSSSSIESLPTPTGSCGTVSWAPSATPSSKRGLVYVQNDEHLEDDANWDQPGTTINWYYNYGWKPSPAYASNPKMQFVPMLFGDFDSTFMLDVVAQLQSCKNISHVLGFNEPDGPFQYGGSEVTPQNAVTRWLKDIEPLKAYGIKLGAPGVTGSPGGVQWLQDFFSLCAGRCTVDFIPLHWYGDFQGLAALIGQIHFLFPNQTLWVTEWSRAGATLHDAQDTYNSSVSYMDNRLPYLTRYSYFGAFRSDISNVGENATFLDSCGNLTDIGAWYLEKPATGNLPSKETCSTAPPVPTATPSGIVRSAGGYNYIGCYAETAETTPAVRTFEGAVFSNATTRTSMTIELCAEWCSGYQYFGVEYAYECYCSNTINPAATEKAVEGCNMVCPGNTDELCGGSWRLVAYHKGHGPSVSISTSKAWSSTSSAVIYMSSSTTWQSSSPSTTTSWPTISSSSLVHSSLPSLLSPSSSLSWSSWPASSSTIKSPSASSILMTSSSVRVTSSPSSSSAMPTTSTPSSTCSYTGLHLPTATPVLGCMSMDDDDDYGLIQLPFQMRLYGVSSNLVFPATNGFLALNQGSAQFDVTSLPTDSIPPATALVYWDDLLLTGGKSSEGIWYYANNTTLIVEWRARQSFDVEDTMIAHFTLTYNTTNPGIVVYHYYELFEGGDNASIGVQGAISGTSFIQYSYKQSLVTAGDTLVCDTNMGTCTRQMSQG